MTLMHRFRRLATRRIPRPLAALAALALLALPAAAQRSGPLVDARRGDGVLEQAGDSDPIVESRVVLRSDGTVWIEARGRARAYEFTGQWRQGEREQRLWSIDRALGEPANAEGWVMTRDGRLKQVEIVGRFAGGRKLRLSFLATADLPPRAPVWDGVDSRPAGDGELVRGRGRVPVRAVRVVLTPEGRAEVVVQALAELRLAGRWLEAGGDRVRFVADGGFGGEAGDGDGTIELRDRELVGLSLRGASGATDYALDFRAAPPAPPAPRPGRQELSERVGYNLEGGDYTSVYFETLRECQAACRRDERCAAYTYNTRSRTCYLKDRTGRYERRDDTVSGDKGDGR